MSLNGKENVNPVKAIIQNEQEPTEMTAEEFKRTLMTWIEDRGLLSDLRAYLRKQMIGILKDTTLGQKTQKLDMKMSPKTHVMNLLIAEFLLKRKYYYTLSVFSTEVPFFISILPEFTTSVINPNMFKTENPSDVKNFTDQNYYDILQTLGFFPDSQECKKLHDLYFHSNENSLLNCMVHLLSKSSKNKNKYESLPQCSKEDYKTLEPWQRNVYKTLIHYEVPTNNIITILDNLKIILEQEKLKIKSEEYTKYNLKQTEINKDLQNRETEIKKLIAKMENTYFEEKKKMTEDLMKEQENFDKMKQNLKQQKYEFEAKNEAFMKKTEIIKQREMEVKEQIDVLKTRIQVMQKVYDSVIEENKKITELRKELQKNEKTPDEIYKKIHNEYVILKNEIEATKRIIEKFIRNDTSGVDKEQQTIEDIKDVNDSEVLLLKGILEKVQNENASLRILNSEQQRRLDNLVIQNTILVNELDTSQSTLNFFTRNNSRRGMITVPPILPPQPLPPAPAATRPGNSHGGGENLGFGAQPVVTAAHRYSFVNNFRNSLRRKDPKRLIAYSHTTTRNNHSNSSSSSSSPTDDVLREARQRLQRLEQETEEVERHYQEYRERQSQTNIPTFPTHTTNSPIARVRVSSTRESYPAFAVNLNNPFRRTFFQQPLTHFNTSTFLNGTRITQNPVENIRYTQPDYYTSRRTISNFIHNIPSTSFNLTQQSHSIPEEQTPEKDITVGDEQNAHSTAPSGSSSRLSQLHNISISTIEISSDSEHDPNN